MPLTAPGSISNSGSKPFSNLFGRIAMDNFNIIKAKQNPYDFYANQKSQPHLASNKYHNLKPMSISEVITSTGLKH
jgi:hypothetical protein